MPADTLQESFCLGFRFRVHQRRLFKIQSLNIVTLYKFVSCGSRESIDCKKASFQQAETATNAVIIKAHAPTSCLA